MKALSLSLSLSVLLLLACAGCTKKAYHTTLIDHRSIEGIKPGMPIHEALDILKKKFLVKKEKTILSDDNSDFTEYVVYNHKKSVLFTFNGGEQKNNKDNVFRIVIKSPVYSTPDGIRVGMTVRELKTKTKLKSADFNYQDGLFLLSSTFDGGFWINLDVNKNYNFIKNKPAIKDIPTDLTIKGIVIF